MAKTEIADGDSWLEGFKEFQAEFDKESDRAAVILGASKLDILLYQLLQAYLLPSTGNSDELLEGNSALSSFSSRIQLCYRLGLIDNELTRALNMVRKIRNSFAHEISTNDLDSGGHRDRVRELTSFFSDSDAYKKLVQARPSQLGPVSKEFRTVVAIISLRLEGAFQRVKRTEAEQVTHLALPEQFKARAAAKKKEAQKVLKKKRASISTKTNRKKIAKKTT